MSFTLVWTQASAQIFRQLEQDARQAQENRKRTGKKKASGQEELFKQVTKCIALLLENLRHPSLQTHEYSSIENPYDKDAQAFEAYIQNQTPSAYRLFWCYGPEKGQITLIAITPHP